MRRRDLTRLGFHTGAPGVARPYTHPLIAEINKETKRNNRSANGSNASPSLTGPRPLARAPSTMSPAPSRTPNSLPSTSLSQLATRPLDPGRLALARSQYESRLAAKQQQQQQQQPNSQPSSELANSSSSPSSSRHKRKRDDADTDNSLQEEDHLTKRIRTTANEQSIDDTTIPNDLPPPLETAVGEEIEVPSSAPSVTSMTAPSSSNSLSHVDSLAVPLSVLIGSTPTSTNGSPATTPTAQASTPSSTSTPASASDVRQKSRDLIQQSIESSIEQLKQSTNEAERLPSSFETNPFQLSALASAIESALFAHPNYRQHVRSLIFNLRRNLTLTSRLLNGSLQPRELSSLSDSDLASPATQAEREAIRAENLASSISKSAQRMETRDYLCPVCHSDQCSTRVIREERDISKADTWGSKQGAGSVIDIQCEACKHSWTKEE